MLKELHGALTSVSPEKLRSLKRILTNTNVKIDIGVKKALFISQLDGAIAATTNLAELRKRASHGTAVEAANKDYQYAIDALCATLVA
jgi:hypothetical protein